jgi:N-acylglucosamine 2-epimerase
MKKNEVEELALFYRNYLNEQIVPFWLENSVDWEYGGYFSFIDQGGALYGHDKICMWNCGRMMWVFAVLYNEFSQKEKLLAAARNGIEFVKKYGFASDGRMYYSLTQTGEPLEESRDVFVELFWVLGLSEIAIACNEEALFEEAMRNLKKIWSIIENIETTPNLFVSSTRRARMHGPYLITLNVAQNLRKYRRDPLLESIIRTCIYYITVFFTNYDKNIVYEIKYDDGNVIPGENGQWICPGHMIEAGIFIINEGDFKNDSDLIKKGVDLIDWGFEWGWDKEFGGIFNDVNIMGRPFGGIRAGVLASLKLWWQHTEAMHGLLLAYFKTGDDKFLESYRLTHDFCENKFSDPNGHEWFGILDSRGNLINSAKGNERKSAFHIVRNFLWNLKLLESI